MVKIKLTTKNLIFTMVHAHQAKSMWLHPLITMDRDIVFRGDPKESNSIRPFVNLSIEEIDCMHDSLINTGVL